MADGAIRVQPARAQGLVINNGLAPPNPENVIDASDPIAYTHVRNVRCPRAGGDYWEPCPSPGSPTHVEIVDGATPAGTCTSRDPQFETSARDSSMITVSGGTFVCLTARENGRLEINGGSFGHVYVYDQSVTVISDISQTGYIIVLDDASVTIAGGDTSGVGVNTSSSVPVLMTGGTHHRLNAHIVNEQTGSYIFEGTNFEIDGASVGYGEYTLGGSGNILTGTWASGENFSVHEIFAPVTLRPPTLTVPALPILPALALAAILLVIGARQIRHRRAV